MALKDWEQTEEFDGIMFSHKRKKLPSGRPQTIRIVTSVGSANYGNVIFGNGQVKHLKDYDKALAFVKQYMRTH